LEPLPIIWLMRMKGLYAIFGFAKMKKAMEFEETLEYNLCKELIVFDFTNGIESADPHVIRDAFSKKCRYFVIFSLNKVGLWKISIGENLVSLVDIGSES